ncbi:MAG: RHS repeat-associated core domain-containing protein, partial [Planctomycetaceae bacterium]|nr:RHS repeat-associated core domain-containing protein [Planctomycetaceae bacterium]
MSGLHMGGLRISRYNRVTFTYSFVNKDGMEYCVQKQTDTGAGVETVKYIWDNKNILQQYDITTEAQYNYQPQAYGNLVSQHQDSESSYYHYDGNFSTTALTDTSEVETDTYKYTAFGKQTILTGTTENPFTYKGEIGYLYDEQTGLFTLRARDYNPDQARFTSEDPIGLDSGESNFYSYVANDPVNVVDPSGLAKVECNYKRRSVRLQQWLYKTKKFDCNSLSKQKCCEDETPTEHDGRYHWSLVSSKWIGQPYSSPSTLPTSAP